MILCITSIKYCPFFMQACRVLTPSFQGHIIKLQEQVLSCLCKDSNKFSSSLHSKEYCHVSVSDSALPCRLVPSSLSLSHAKLVCFQIPSLPFPFKSCHGIAPVLGLMLSSFTAQILLHRKRGLHSPFYNFSLKGLHRHRKHIPASLRPLGCTFFKLSVLSYTDHSRILKKTNENQKPEKHPLTSCMQFLYVYTASKTSQMVIKLQFMEYYPY